MYGPFFFKLVHRKGECLFHNVHGTKFPSLNVIFCSVLLKMVLPKFRPRTTGRIVYQNSQPDCFLRWYKLQRKASTLKSSVEQLGTFKETNWYGHLWVESDQIATVFKGVDKFPTNHVPPTSNSKNWHLRV